MIDLSLRTADDIVTTLCQRLRKERLAKQMTQAELAARAGIGVNTVSNLEAGKNVGFENLVRVALVLGYGPALEDLFRPKIDSLDDILRYEKSATRQRVKRKHDDA